jgi:hypothetical protein
MTESNERRIFVVAAFKMKDALVWRHVLSGNRNMVQRQRMRAFKEGHGAMRMLVSECLSERDALEMEAPVAQRTQPAVMSERQVKAKCLRQLVINESQRAMRALRNAPKFSGKVEELWKFFPERCAELVDPGGRDCPLPKASPKFVADCVKKQARGQAMALDGSRMDFLKRAHDLEPSTDEHDSESMRMPWKWMTKFLQALDAGQLVFRNEEEDTRVYKSFVDASLVVEAKGDGSPRPCAMVRPARKLGGAFNITGVVRKARGELMKEWRNLGFGTEAANDLMPLHFQMRLERDGEDVAIAELDVAGACPNVRRIVVQKALGKLTGCLEFLKHRFYASHHMVAQVMYTDLKGEEHWHDFGEGLQQGAGSSGFEHSGAHDLAMEPVRVQFAACKFADVSYIDDARAALNATARVETSKHPLDEPFVVGANSMPLGVAITKSMKRNFKETCGLDISFRDSPNGKGHKNRVIRFDDPDDTVLAEHGDPEGKHIKVVHGGTMA